MCAQAELLATLRRAVPERQESRSDRLHETNFSRGKATQVAPASIQELHALDVLRRRQHANGQREVPLEPLTDATTPSSTTTARSRSPPGPRAVATGSYARASCAAAPRGQRYHDAEPIASARRRVRADRRQRLVHDDPKKPRLPERRRHEHGVRALWPRLAPWWWIVSVPWSSNLALVGVGQRLERPPRPDRLGVLATTKNVEA